MSQNGIKPQSEEFKGSSNRIYKTPSKSQKSIQKKSISEPKDFFPTIATQKNQSNKIGFQNQYIIIDSAKNIQNHVCSKLPDALNPSFKKKYSNDIADRFMKFVENYQDLKNVNDSMLLEEYAKANKLQYRESHNRQKLNNTKLYIQYLNRDTRTFLRQKHVGMAIDQSKKHLYKKSNLRYFQIDESFIKQEEINTIMKNEKKTKKKKGDNVPLDKVFKHKNLENDLNQLILKINRGKSIEKIQRPLYTESFFLSQQIEHYQ